MYHFSYLFENNWHNFKQNVQRVVLMIWPSSIVFKINSNKKFIKITLFYTWRDVLF